MARWQNEDDQDDLDATEDPDESGQDADDDASDALPCPHCGRDVYENADRCPYCGQYVTLDTVSGRKAWWYIITAVLALLAVLAWAFL